MSNQIENVLRTSSLERKIYCRYEKAIGEASRRSGISRELLTAVISRESGGRNVRGDGGHGRGLMQIDDRYPPHAQWLKANRDGLDPHTNIGYGAALLAENLASFDGIEHAALAAYNAGPAAVRRALARGADPDSVTTGRDYSADVLRRARSFAEQLLNGTAVCLANARRAQ